jgi:hypothetical protein
MESKRKISIWRASAIMGAFHDYCAVAIGKRLAAEIKLKWLRICGYWHPRGDIPVDVFWQTRKWPKTTCAWILISPAFSSPCPLSSPSAKNIPVSPYRNS